ncbi:relaxase/mobilization nuclease domain-containing protein [Mucilaginibacter daejeonensis]|uniref:relaxase/mobilization nuclease domain-containing protein n=1 Tax=Mucilaginibacter daejeonensis TaxID=398049 RepID=UPI001D17442F|nr:relaxase/mobilization nuclease domain-containing protein [Mucilaginibacter daejeonensis]UEG54901.1 relaxase/mobilization nuclease domain-containing protein [Mucilaginibacter daejeonensis]
MCSGKAELIMAQGYLKEPCDLTFDNKVERLTDLTRRNERTQVNALHVSLNFAMGENLGQGTLQQIANEYMEGLGFGRQPYLVYQHYDAGHPHLHIVSTNIRPDGDRISFHLLANKASELSRKKVEKDFGLIKAEDQRKDQKLFPSLSLEQVTYGRSETKRAITNVVNEVLRTYKFTSLPELNAVLNTFNVTADRGGKESKMFEKNGLVYWALDVKGGKIGVPIKASSIYGKPTIRTLEGRFTLNEVLRKVLRVELRDRIDKVLANSNTTAEFQVKLKDQNIDAIFRHSNDGRLYGVTFVDHHIKAVFNGSDLCKEHSANGLSQHFAQRTDPAILPQQTMVLRTDLSIRSSLVSDDGQHYDDRSAIEVLFQGERERTDTIGDTQQRKRKKKRRGHSL